MSNKLPIITANQQLVVFLSSFLEKGVNFCIEIKQIEKKLKKSFGEKKNEKQQ